MDDGQTSEKTNGEHFIHVYTDRAPTPRESVTLERVRSPKVTQSSHTFQLSGRLALNGLVPTRRRTSWLEAGSVSLRRTESSGAPDSSRSNFSEENDRITRILRSRFPANRHKVPTLELMRRGFATDIPRGSTNNAAFSRTIADIDKT